MKHLNLFGKIYVITVSVMLLFTFGYLIWIPVSSLLNFNLRHGDLVYRIVEGQAVIRDYREGTATELIIPDYIDGYRVTEVANFGVVNTDRLERIVIGRYVSRIHGWSFTNNQALREFEVDPLNRHFKACGRGVLFNYNMTVLLFYPNGQWEWADTPDGRVRQINYDIPEGVTEIGIRAFYKCWFTNDIGFPSTLVRIGRMAFANNDIRHEFDFGHLTNLRYIETDAFQYCWQLRRVVIPSSVVYIGDYAFFNNTRMEQFIVHLREEATADWGFKWWPTNNGDPLSGFSVTFLQ
jgi:hypothetical protein